MGDGSLMVTSTYHDLCISSSIMKLEPTFYARPHYKDMLMPFKIRAGLASL